MMDLGQELDLLFDENLPKNSGIVQNETMSGHKQFSLRYKILLLLTLIPLIVLVLYLGLAVNVFKQDKIAYVFESSTSVAKSLSSQASTELNAVLSSSKPMMQEFLLKQKFDEVSEGVMSVDGPVLWMAVFRMGVFGQSLYERIDKIERVQGQTDSDIQALRDLLPYLKEAKTKGRVFLVPFRDDRVMMVERVGAVDHPEVRYFVIFAKMEGLANSFRRPGQTENYFVRNDGYIFFGPAGSEAQNINEKIGEDFLRNAKASQFASGASGIRSDDGSDLLASFSKASFGDTTVITLSRQSDALKAVNVLMQRSLYFMGVLLSGTIIVSLFASGTITSALTDLFQATKKIAEGHFDIRVNVKSNDEVGSLATSFNVMAEEVQRLLLETADKARMASELKTAQTVQETLFPEDNKQFGGFYISGHYEPASECGGDWWHYCEVGKKIYLWIGDATGHGAPAALITSAAKSAATIIETLNSEPAQALDLLNRAIYDVSKGRIMMTFFLACFDRETKKFTYANASHEAPYLINKLDRPLKKKDLVPLNEVNSPRLGQARDTHYEQTSIDLNLGDRILFYTDGIPDIESPDKQAWGEREFIKGILASNADYPPVQDSVKKLVELFSSYRQGTTLKDDITFFMCEYREDIS